MLRVALLSGRGRLATFAGALVALTASSALVMAGGMPFEAALRTQPPVERYAAAAAVVTGQQVVGTDDDVVLGERARVDSAVAARLAAVHGVRRQAAIFLTDREALRVAGHPGRVDAIGVLAAPGFDASRLQTAAGGAKVLTGDERGRAEYPELLQTRTELI